MTFPSSATLLAHQMRKKYIKSVQMTFSFTCIHLADANIALKINISSVHAFPEKRTHVLGVASAMLYCFNYRND